MTFNSLICHRSYPCLPSPDPLPLEPASVAQGLAYSRVMTVQRQNWQGQVPSRETLSVRRELRVGCFVFRARRDLSAEAGRVCHRLISVIGTVCNSRTVSRRAAGLWAMTGALGVEGEMVRCGVSRLLLSRCRVLWGVHRTRAIIPEPKASDDFGTAQCGVPHLSSPLIQGMCTIDVR